jgi:hypothetical protein
VIRIATSMPRVAGKVLRAIQLAGLVVWLAPAAWGQLPAGYQNLATGASGDVMIVNAAWVVTNDTYVTTNTAPWFGLHVTQGGVGYLLPLRIETSQVVGLTNGLAALGSHTNLSLFSGAHPGSSMILTNTTIAGSTNAGWVQVSAGSWLAPTQTVSSSSSGGGITGLTASASWAGVPTRVDASNWTIGTNGPGMVLIGRNAATVGGAEASTIAIDLPTSPVYRGLLITAQGLTRQTTADFSDYLVMSFRSNHKIQRLMVSAYAANAPNNPGAVTEQTNIQVLPVFGRLSQGTNWVGGLTAFVWNFNSNRMHGFAHSAWRATSGAGSAFESFFDSNWGTSTQVVFSTVWGPMTNTTIEVWGIP